MLYLVRVRVRVRVWVRVRVGVRVRVRVRDSCCTAGSAARGYAGKSRAPPG